MNLQVMNEHPEARSRAAGAKSFLIEQMLKKYSQTSAIDKRTHIKPVEFDVKHAISTLFRKVAVI